eukprot:948029_1
MAQNTEPSDDSKTKERANIAGTGTHTRSAPGSITAMTKTKSLSNRSNQISINATKHTHTHTHTHDNLQCLTITKGDYALMLLVELAYEMDISDSEF